MAATNEQAGGGASLADTMQMIMARSDLLVAGGIVGILAVLLFPMAPIFLDLCLGISLMFSVLILMISLFIQRPLEFSAFPTVLLIATLMRLSLNLASTRLILSRGHEGTDAAGNVIESFGHFIMQGNVVIGAIIFAILVLVNFVVVTKGSGRIAEVAARFTLDSMPGKQMAIDADLSAGLIDEETAKKRRKELEDESNFFGAMDGASKFVRGDAIAGLIITFINIIGGMIIGLAQKGMDFTDAASTYTILTIGDGLISQIPALIVSVGAGMLVSKSGVDGSTDKALITQFTNYPQALGMASAVLAIVMFLPGMPTLPFMFLSGGAAAGAYYIGRQQKEDKAKADREENVRVEQSKPKEEPISAALAMDNLRIEMGYGLLPLINDAEGYRLTDQIKALRRQIAVELGFVMPSVRILDNMQLPTNDYRIKIKEMDAGGGVLKVNHLLVMDPRGAPVGLSGEETKEPAFGLPAKWVDQSLREEASFRGYTVVDPATVMTTHLTEIIKDNMAELLSYAETKKLLDDLPAEHQKLIEDLVPNQITITGIQRILQSLLRERVSIRDLPTILEGISEATGFTSSVPMITEHVRMRLARQICAAHADPVTNQIPLLVMSGEWEQAFAESLAGQGEDKQLAMAPSTLQDFITQLSTAFEQMAEQGEAPVLLTSPLSRPYVRSVLERVRPQTVVMSQNEIHPQARLRTLGQV